MASASRPPSERLRLDVVSPLPPVRSGIADYCADLLPELGRRADLRLVHLPGQPVAPEIAQHWQLVAPECLGEDGRLPLYHMGNNPYHFAVHDLALAIPGFLVLHDVVLHHFLINRTINRGDFAGYRQQLALDHGWIGDAAARPMRWPGGAGNAVQFALPCHRTLLARQRGVLTHSQWAVESLQEEMGPLRVRAIPMGVPLGEAADAAAGRDFRDRHGLPHDQPVLGSFGFQTPMKRTEVVIATLARPELADVHFMIAGEVAPVVELEKYAREAGVADRVHVLGFLPFSDFQSAIAAADVCVNLRYPTAGETSASLLRILAVGRPTIVSDYAQSSDLPDDGVVKVPVGDGEAEALTAELIRLLRSPERCREMGAAARDYVRRHHDPALAAAAVVEVLGEWWDEPPQALPHALPLPPTSALWPEFEGTVEVRGAEAPWPPGERRQLEIRLVNQSAARWLAGEHPEGGIAVEVQLFAGAADVRAGCRWLPLPQDLGPGEEQIFRLALRRPLGPTQLRVVPHVLGRAGFPDLGGPAWEAEV